MPAYDNLPFTTEIAIGRILRNNMNFIDKFWAGVKSSLKSLRKLRLQGNFDCR